MLKVEEEFPVFQDFDSTKFSEFQRFKSELKEMNKRIHQMSIMSRIDHNSVFFSSHQMKDFMRQGGSLQSVLEIQHNLGFGIEETKWKEMEGYQIRERTKNIIYAMLGASVSQEKPKLLWYVYQQWCGTYTREFFFQQPQLSKIFDKRFGILVEYADKLKPTMLGDWMQEAEASKLGDMAQCKLQWGKVMVGSTLYRSQMKHKEHLYWPSDLPSNMNDHFENFKKFFGFFGKHLLCTKKS
ncbi:hypothetical protein DFH28DRAFT_963602 [Melampsora americana]|nr:hypothetical protein DFH28DRAFT_963602 [Melampsora americana]